MTPDATPRRGTEAIEAIEEIARAMCKVDGGEPDEMVVMGEPARSRFGYVVASKAWPLWTYYAPMATVALETIKDRAVRLMSDAA